MTTQLEQAARLALEALELLHPLTCYDRITALRAALEQPVSNPNEFKCPICYDDPANIKQPAQDEPVAWMFQHEETGRTMCVDAQQVEWGFEKGNPRLTKIAPLYTTPPAAPVQGPPPGTISTTITTTPQPKREWVGLTDEEIDELEDDRSLETTHDFICAIEAKLKEKNT